MSDPAPQLIERRACLGILGAAALLAPALGRAATAAAASADLSAKLEPVRVKYGLPALAAALTDHGQVVAAGCTGVRAHGSAVAATITDRFHIGSDTKAMTATLAGMAVEAGQLKWDSSLGEVLGPSVAGMNAALAAVTLEQLLSHSGGIPTDTEELLRLYFNTDAFEYNLTALRLRLIEAWKSHAPVSPPGKAFHYANLGYLMAGAMLEKATGTPWEALITERLFAPLGLKSAGLGAQATMGRLDAPVGHNIDADGTIRPMTWGAAADAPPVIGPAGIAHMSVLDFATWADWNSGRARRGPRLVSPETLARIHRPHVSTGRIPNPRPGTPAEGEYALGWGVVRYPWMRNPVLQHNGSNSMNLAKILVDPVAEVGIVVLTNFPGPKAEDATTEVTLGLYPQHLRV